jgi:hypothetical protein
VGEVLAGELQEDTVSLYVFPDCIMSAQFASLTEGSGLLVLATDDSAHASMEGFRTSDRDWAVILLTVEP